MVNEFEKVYDEIALKYDDFNKSMDPNNVIQLSIIDCFDLLRYSRYLNIGIGTATLDIALAEESQKDVHITGIDISKSMLEVAHENIAKKGLTDHFTLLHSDINEYLFEENFDAVILASTLRLLKNQKQILKNCYESLNQNGCLVVQDIKPDENPDSFNAKILSTVYPDVQSKNSVIDSLEEVGFKNIRCVEFEIKPDSFEYFHDIRNLILKYADINKKSKFDEVVRTHKQIGGFRSQPKLTKYFLAVGKKV